MKKRYFSIDPWALLISLFILVALILIFILLDSFQEPCGGYDRFDVKTCQDKEASMIHLKTINTTISQLRLKWSPVKIASNTPRLLQEMQTYTVDCRIVKYLAENDGDYHLVLADLKDGSTLVAEMPNPLCSMVQKSKFINQFTNARTELLKYAKGGKVKDGVYRIKGVLFFDQTHSKNPTGNAPFSTELHPILSFKKVV